MATSILYWRRIDLPGLERLGGTTGDEGCVAASTGIRLADGGYRGDHRWRFDREWRVQAVVVERWGPQGRHGLRLERAEGGWCVDGTPRPDLDGAEEPDLSVTPFCNTLAIRRVPPDPGATRTLDVAYIDGLALTVARSRQRYVRLGAGRLRYVDLGTAVGFEAEISVDDAGWVLQYPPLFERVTPGA